MLSFNQMKIYIINIYKYTAEQIWPLCLSLTQGFGGGDPGFWCWIWGPGGFRSHSHQNLSIVIKVTFNVLKFNFNLVIINYNGSWMQYMWTVRRPGEDKICFYLFPTGESWNRTRRYRMSQATLFACKLKIFGYAEKQIEANDNTVTTVMVGCSYSTVCICQGRCKTLNIFTGTLVNHSCHVETEITQTWWRRF